MRVMTVCLCLAAAAALASPAGAITQYSTDHQIEVEQAWARLAPKEPDTASVFFEVYNQSEKSDVLLSASSPAAENITIRRGTWQGFNFLNRESDGIKIKARKTTSFHPGQYEITLSDLRGHVNVGTVLPVTLYFKEAGAVTIEAQVANQLLGNRINK